MIVKTFELKKKIKEFNYFLLYGNNSGAIEESIEKSFKPIFTNNVYNYDENEILKDLDNFLETTNNKSFFENEKLIIIKRASDKIYKVIENFIAKEIPDISIILTSSILEKKSKLRNFFEKNKNTVCVPFYEDDARSLSSLAINFFKEKKISLSQQNINLIIERARGDRINLYNELNKIENFSKKGGVITTDDILKLTNLSSNFDASELIDNTLAKNKKKTLYLLNENNFASEDAILILRVFLNKLKRLMKIQNQVKEEKNIEKVVANFKPPIFWKEKDILKKQIQIWSFRKINDLIREVNKIELIVKKNPSSSISIVTNFILEKAIETNNEI